MAWLLRDGALGEGALVGEPSEDVFESIGAQEEVGEALAICLLAQHSRTRIHDHYFLFLISTRIK